MRRVRIFGAGIRGAVAADLMAWGLSSHYALEGFYDDGKPAGELGPFGAPILGTVSDGIEQTGRDGALAFVAIGTLRSSRRAEILHALRRADVEVASLVSPDAHISPSATIGLNALIMPGVVIAAAVSIGDLFVAHGGAVVEHHASVGDNVLFGPNAAVASAVHVGSHTFLGAGTNVIPSTRIGQGTLIGAGSVVISEIPDFVVAAGSPARVLRRVREGDEVPAAEQIAALERFRASAT